MKRRSELATFLDRLAAQYHRRELLDSDPLEFVTLYTDPWDQETVALVSALLAYGNVAQIRKSITAALAILDRRGSKQAHPCGPAEFVRRLDDPKFRKLAETEFADWVHRFNTGTDLIALLRLIGQSCSTHGSVGAHFIRGLRPEAPDFADALNRLIHDWSVWSGGAAAAPGLRFFLTAPAAGSCCKRWCMFLRWMGRSDELDPGLWTRHGGLAREASAGFAEGRFLRSSQLIIPLDTHVSRISRYLGLTSRKATDWKTALEVTSALREINPEDPVKYDFALARLGILDICSGTWNEKACPSCQIRSVCGIGRAGGKNAPLRRPRLCR